MKKEVITIEEAITVRRKYPTEADYIMANLEHFMDRNNDPDDNSIELADYYCACIKVLSNSK